MSEKKSFHISVLLSMTTGRLYCDMDDLYALTRHMTSKAEIDTFQLADQAETVRKAVNEQMPWLKEIKPLGFSENSGSEERVAAINEWVSALETKYGAYHDVAPMKNPSVKSSEESLLSVKSRQREKKAKSRKTTLDRVRGIKGPKLGK